MTDPNQPPRILGVNDDPAIQGVMESILKGAKVQCDFVDIVPLAVAKLQSGDYDGVLTEAMRGTWPEIIEAVRLARANATVALLTNSSITIGHAAELRVPAFSKQRLKDSDRTIREIATQEVRDVFSWQEILAKNTQT